MIPIRMIWDEGADPALGLPRYESSGAAGADLRANFPDRGSVTLISDAGAETWPRMAKDEVATRLAARIAEALKEL